MQIRRLRQYVMIRALIKASLKIPNEKENIGNHRSMNIYEEQRRQKKLNNFVQPHGYHMKINNCVKTT